MPLHLVFMLQDRLSMVLISLYRWQAYIRLIWWIQSLLNTHRLKLPMVQTNLVAQLQFNLRNWTMCSFPLLRNIIKRNNQCSMDLKLHLVEPWLTNAFLNKLFHNLILKQIMAQVPVNFTSWMVLLVYPGRTFIRFWVSMTLLINVPLVSPLYISRLECSLEVEFLQAQTCLDLCQ